MQFDYADDIAFPSGMHTSMWPVGAYVPPFVTFQFVGTLYKEGVKAL